EAEGFVRNCDEQSEINSEFKVYMRYAGQGWEIPISLTQEQAMNPDPSVFQACFEEDYINLFGRSVEGMEIEVTVWSVNATTPPEHFEAIERVAGLNTAESSGKRRIFDSVSAEFLNAEVVERGSMADGDVAQGPAAITERETTIIVPASRSAVRQPDGCIEVFQKPN
ncbi:MAG: hydantoinase/oxoprolinase family protein, partial [Pseudomonadota bacterium]